MFDRTTPDAVLPWRKEFDLFISYSSADAVVRVKGKKVPVIATLKRALEAHLHPDREGVRKAGARFKVCTFEEDFELRATVREAIHDKIASSWNLLVIVSVASAESEYVQDEVAHYCDSRGGEKPLAASLDKLPADAFPNVFDEDSLAADLAIEVGMSVKDWRRKVDRESHKIVARVWDCSLEEIHDRFAAGQRARQRRFVASVGGVLVGILLLGAAVQVLRNPTHAWMNDPSTRSIEVQDGAVVVDGQGNERIRLWGNYGVSGSFAEDVGEGRHVIWELDTRGRLTGCAAFKRDDADPVESVEDIERFGGLGTLEDEWRASTDVLVELSKLRWVGQGAAIALRYRDGRGPLPMYSIFEDGDADTTMPQEPVQAALTDAKLDDVDRVRKDRSERSNELVLFQVAPQTKMAFVGVTKGEELHASLACVLTTDGERAWTLVGTQLLNLNGSGITGLTRAGGSGDVFYLSAEESGWDWDFKHGGVWVTRNRCETWIPVEVPEPWKGWTAFSGVAADGDNAHRLAVALQSQRLSRHTRPPGVPGVLFTDDGGDTWKPLATGLDIPKTAIIRLLGITSQGRVVAVVDTTGDGKGRVIIWRKLSLMERLTGIYGVSLGG